MRLDKYLFEKKLAESRSKATNLIKMGKVFVNDKKITKQSYDVKNNDKIILSSNFIYASRGGYKIESVFKKFNLTAAQKKVLDIGCSTGGFSDFFLKNGASRVLAVDIAKDIIDRRLLKDSRLQFTGGIDARNRNMLNTLIKNEKFDMISIDVSNVPVNEIISAVSPFLDKDGLIIALFKPHYEGEKGVVSETKRKGLTEKFEKWLNSSYSIIAKEPSPIRGGSKNKGNVEFFYAIKPLHN